MRTFILTAAALSLTAAVGCEQSIDESIAPQSDCDRIDGCEHLVGAFPGFESQDDKHHSIPTGAVITFCSDEWDAPHAVRVDDTVELGGLVRTREDYSIERADSEARLIESIYDSPIELGIIRYLGTLPESMAPAEAQSHNIEQGAMDLRVDVLETGEMFLVGELESDQCVSLFDVVISR